LGNHSFFHLGTTNGFVHQQGMQVRGIKRSSAIVSEILRVPKSAQVGE
jgi:hypothetical protein